MRREFVADSGRTMTDAAPAISVLMGVRNGEAYLDEAIESILAQTFADFELIIVDNGSVDGTADIIDRHALSDRRVRGFRLDRPGLSRTLNHAAAQARAPILARLDADDVAEPERFAIQHAVLTADPTLAVIGSYALLINERGRALGEIRPPVGRDSLRAYLAAANPFIHSTTMFRRSCFEQVGGYRVGLRYTEDLDLWLRLAEVGELDLIPKVLARYRQHSGSLMWRQRLRMVLGDTCARGAVEARRTGREEPFAKGCPQLRPALLLLGIDRAQFRVWLTDYLKRQRMELLFLLLPIPARLKMPLRRLPAALGMRRLYRWLLGLGGR